MEQNATPRCAAVIVAAGNASRMGGIDKILTPILEEKAVVHAVRPFQRSPWIDEIVVVTRADRIEPVRKALAKLPKVTAVVCGGETRTDSVRAGMAAASERCRLLAIHDGARPCVTEAIIAAAVQAAADSGAAAPAIPVRDTIYRCVGGRVTEIPDRSELMAVQTPQVVAREILTRALAAAQAEGVALTDDCGAAFRLGVPVTLTPGSPENLKITTPVDLIQAAEILRRRRKA